MKNIIRTAYAVTLLLGGIAVATPAFAIEAEAGPVIKCEKCSCNMNTGICECTGCTITQS